MHPDPALFDRWWRSGEKNPIISWKNIHFSRSLFCQLCRERYRARSFFKIIVDVCDHAFGIWTMYCSFHPTIRKFLVGIEHAFLWTLENVQFHNHTHYLSTIIPLLSLQTPLPSLLYVLYVTFIARGRLSSPIFIRILPTVHLSYIFCLSREHTHTAVNFWRKIDLH
jgi:hypothetical protein